MLSLVLILSILTVCFADNDMQCRFLQVTDEASLQSMNETDVSNALLTFQEYYKLPIDGDLNNETEYLMSKPRCGNADIISDYTLTVYKWNKPTLTWRYYLANQQVLELTKKAFSLWEENSGLHFIHDTTNTDILIADKRRKHMMVKKI